MTRRVVRGWMAACAVAVCATSAEAQTPPLVVERPSFSTPPEVVGRGFWQVEAGVGWDHDAPADGDGVTTVTAPNVTLRLGVSRRLELRAATTGLVSVSDAARRQTSAADTDLGVKYQLAFQDGFGLNIAVVPMISLPTGGRASSNSADPSVIVTAARRFGAAQINGNVRWSRQTYGSAARDHAQRLDWSLVAAYALRGRWSAFWEGVVSHSDLATAPTTWLANAGVERQIGDALIVDVYGGRGLNDAAPNWRAGAGVGWRLRR